MADAGVGRGALRPAPARPVPAAPAPVPPGRGGRPGDAGFTLVEVMAAIVVFVVVSTATVAILIQALRVVRENADRVMAASIARSQVEYLRTLGTSNIPIGLTVGAVPAGQSTARVDPKLLDAAFTIRTTSNWVGFDQTENSCTAATPGQSYLRVTVEVSSANLGRPITMDTVIFPDTSAQVSGTGSATVSVVDQVGAPVSDVVVRGTDAFHPTNNFTLTTGVDGCLFMPGLTVSGSLAVNVSRSGYVSQTPTGTDAVLQVSAGNVSRSSFKLAPAATLQFAGADGTFPLPADIPVTWQFKTTGASDTAAILGSPVTGLWPEPSGLTAFAGSCTDADPLTYSLTRTSYTLDAGGTSVALLASAPVRLRGLPADTPVTAIYAGTDGACSPSPIVVGRSNDRGILRTGLPYGDWRFTAEGETQVLPGALVPLADGTPPEPVTVNFTLADLDNPCPTASPVPSGSPTPDPTASPDPSSTLCPSPSVSPSESPTGETP